MASFRHGRLFFVTSTTVTATLKTSTLCFTKPSCASQAPFDPPGVPAGGGASPMGPKMCATGCPCAPLTAVMCGTGAAAGARCRIFRTGPTPRGVPLCPAGCVPGPIRPIRDPCDSCTVTDSMADMMVATCPGRKKRRAILESAPLGDQKEISPSPAISHSDFER